MTSYRSAALRIFLFLAVEPCDMRKLFNGLYELACRDHDTRPPGRDRPCPAVGRSRETAMAGTDFVPAGHHAECASRSGRVATAAMAFQAVRERMVRE